MNRFDLNDLVDQKISESDSGQIDILDIINLIWYEEE